MIILCSSINLTVKINFLMVRKDSPFPCEMPPIWAMLFKQMFSEQVMTTNDIQRNVCINTKVKTIDKK